MTVMEGLSGRVSVAGLMILWSTWDAALVSGSWVWRVFWTLPDSILPMNRYPLRATVRTRRCASPLSPIALRTALIWLVMVDSETIRPLHTACSNSSLLQAVIAVADQHQQDIEDLRPDSHVMASQGQLPALLIQHVVLKDEWQCLYPLTWSLGLLVH